MGEMATATHEASDKAWVAVPFSDSLETNPFPAFPASSLAYVGLWYGNDNIPAAAAGDGVGDIPDFGWVRLGPFFARLHRE